MAIFEEPTRKPGDLLALALANMSSDQGASPGRVGADNPNAVGTMSAADRGMLGGIRGGIVGTGILGGLLGIGGMAALGPAAMAPAAILGLDKLFGWAGVPTAAISPWGGMPTEQDVQTARDLFGNIRGAELQGMRDSWGPNFSDMTPGLTGYSAAEAAQGGIGGGGLDGGGFGDAAGASGTGEGGMARGGVTYATHPQTVTFGEPSTGGETGIFIPEWMKRPGAQAGEMAVRSALRRALMQLGGR